jgi:acyl-CoA dehydrogenase
MDFALTDNQESIRDAVATLCRDFDDAYWLNKDREGGFPFEFHKAMAEAGWLGVCIPEEYGGSGLGITEAAIIMRTISESGAGMSGASAIHMNIFGLNPVVVFGNDEQRKRMLPPMAEGKQKSCFAVTEPNTGLNTTQLKLRAERKGDRYVVNGRKMFISRALQSDLMLLLARTTSAEQVKKRTDGLSVFLIDIRGLKGLEIRPLRMMMNHSTNALFFDDVEIPADSLVGEEGKGFHYILSGMNAERILVASESIGDGRWFTDKAVAYSQGRVIFGKPIGTNQGVQFPIAKAYTNVEAAALMRDKAAALFDAGEPCGAEANMAKYLAAEAAWEAGNACIDCHGGYGYAEEYDVERKFRECRLYKTAPVNNNLVLAYVGEHVLGMPRSY